ncbi:MAG: type II toxin-antitoxin system RelE/ParE family toxin [Geminicoccaceae bacterium]
MYEIEEYTTEDGHTPFSEWLLGLRDRRAQARILSRLDRVQLGNLGDWKALGGRHGLAELRDPYGPGLRIYFGDHRRACRPAAGGSTKRDQRSAILAGRSASR